MSYTYCIYEQIYAYIGGRLVDWTIGPIFAAMADCSRPTAILVPVYPFILIKLNIRIQIPISAESFKFTPAL